MPIRTISTCRRSEKSRNLLETGRFQAFGFIDNNQVAWSGGP